MQDDNVNTSLLKLMVTEDIQIDVYHMITNWIKQRLKQTYQYGQT